MPGMREIHQIIFFFRVLPPELVAIFSWPLHFPVILVRQIDVEANDSTRLPSGRRVTFWSSLVHSIAFLGCHAVPKPNTRVQFDEFAAYVKTHSLDTTEKLLDHLHANKLVRFIIKLPNILTCLQARAQFTEQLWIRLFKTLPSSPLLLPLSDSTQYSRLFLLS